MSNEWTGPLAEPPFWLNPRLEHTAAMEPAKLPKFDFLLKCLLALLARGCDIEQAIGITANTVVETGWGKKYRGNNLGGVKANKSNTKFTDFWWRALGHKKSGDPQTCFYKSFPTFESFFDYWLRVFVPKPGAAPKSRYKKTGEEFWSGKPWFDDLIAAGYKGEVTRMHPEDSLESFEEICDTLEKVWIQSKIGVVVDGQWGPRSRTAALAWSRAHGLTPTDQPSRALLWAVTHPDKVCDTSRLGPAICAQPTRAVLSPVVEEVMPVVPPTAPVFVPPPPPTLALADALAEAKEEEDEPAEEALIAPPPPVAPVLPAAPPAQTTRPVPAPRRR